MIDEAEALREQIIQVRTPRGGCSHGTARALAWLALRASRIPNGGHFACVANPFRHARRMQVDSFEKLGREAADSSYVRPALKSPYGSTKAGKIGHPAQAAQTQAAAA